jgi:deoxyribonuclease-2
MRVLSFLGLVSAATASFSCKSETGIDVGNWTILKFPQSTSYVYSTESQKSQYSLNDTTNGALAQTIQQLWLPAINYALYNDEAPYATSYNFSVAHAKAVLMWDTETIIALFHSIPKFPVGPEEASSYIGLLSNAWDYAQHIACVNLPIQNLGILTASLSALTPYVYEGELPTEPVNTEQSCQYIQIGSNSERTLITKPQAYSVDIWETCVSQYFNTDIQVMSWIHGTMDGPFTNQTTTRTTTDIAEIAYSFGISYKEYDNHAKWAIGIKPLVCIGDLNRVETQKQRSGMALCWDDYELWNSLDILVQPA